MNWGQAIQKARKSRSVSQRSLARQAGLDPSYVSHIEAGRRGPSLSAIEAICKALGISVPALALHGADPGELVEVRKKLRSIKDSAK